MNNSQHIFETNKNTIVGEYEPTINNKNKSFSEESALENYLIEMLENQGYEYASEIKNEEQLLANLRNKIEKLNNTKFSDQEWNILKRDYLCKPNESIEDKTQRIQNDYLYTLKRDNDESENIKIINKKDIHSNSLQVINQFRADSKIPGRKNRYDVTILVNGLPLVHIELKKSGVNIENAFNQIERYQAESFDKSEGLFNYVQIFIISNGTLTKYYSNTTRKYAIDQRKETAKKETRSSNSFKFTNYWANVKNKLLEGIEDFTKTFLRKSVLLEVLTKYCVYTEDNKLLVMRPYQIAAAEGIINKLRLVVNYPDKFKGNKKGGYIWHTTGSGKTLTSFKTAQLATQISELKKIIFVVDRKDLDYQTINEFNKFQKGSVASTRSTNILAGKITSTKETDRVIVTTIQKLSRFVNKNHSNLSIFNENVVFIFDECHRSQFGKMHAQIKKKFKNAIMFGFTGTPILDENSASASNNLTTEALFGEKIHSYTIIDAIRDENVLKFNVEYAKIEHNLPLSISEEDIYMQSGYISAVVSHILDNFDKKTLQNESYNAAKLTNIKQLTTRNDGAKQMSVSVQQNGFNSIFAVSSIAQLKLYYDELIKQIEKRQSNIKIAAIYSKSATDSEEYEDIDGNDFEAVNSLSDSDKKFLTKIINNYNNHFGTNYSIDDEGFASYYKDISLRTKNKEIDILLVVNMFLTGFDAPTLNTLWVDKNLKHHSLLQAFSRTNRIYNNVKDSGNIVCYRDLKQQVDESIRLFSDEDTASTIVLMRTFEEYNNGYYNDKGEYQPGFSEIQNNLKQKFNPNDPYVFDKLLSFEPFRNDFLRQYNSFIKLKNIIQRFDEFNEEKHAIVTSDENLKYKSWYLELHDRAKNTSKDHTPIEIPEDIVWNIEIIRQDQITVLYVLNLINKYKQANNYISSEYREKIMNAVNSAIDTRRLADIFEKFIDICISKEADEDDIVSQFKNFAISNYEQEKNNLITNKKLKQDKIDEKMVDFFKEAKVNLEGSLNDLTAQRISSRGDSKAKRQQWFEEIREGINYLFNKYFVIKDDIVVEYEKSLSN
ncbi:MULTISPECIES: type I restriction endonuclease subunit R [unclassified Mycoplasma]